MDGLGRRRGGPVPSMIWMLTLAISVLVLVPVPVSYISFVWVIFSRSLEVALSFKGKDFCSSFGLNNFSFSLFFHTWVRVKQFDYVF